MESGTRAVSLIDAFFFIIHIIPLPPSIPSPLPNQSPLSSTFLSLPQFEPYLHTHLPLRLREVPFSPSTLHSKTLISILTYLLVLTPPPFFFPSPLNLSLDLDLGPSPPLLPTPPLPSHLNNLQARIRIEKPPPPFPPFPPSPAQSSTAF